MAAYQEIVRDVTDRKQAERALSEMQRRQRVLLNNIPDIAWVKDKEGRFVAVNASALQSLWTYSRGDRRQNRFRYGADGPGRAVQRRRQVCHGVTPTQAR